MPAARFGNCSSEEACQGDTFNPVVVSIEPFGHETHAALSLRPPASNTVGESDAASVGQRRQRASQPFQRRSRETVALREQPA